MQMFHAFLIYCDKTDSFNINKIHLFNSKQTDVLDS